MKVNNRYYTFSMNNLDKYFILCLSLVPISLVYYLMSHAIGSSSEAISAISTFVIAILTIFLVTSPWQEKKGIEAKKKEIHRQIIALSKLLRLATKYILPRMSKVGLAQFNNTDEIESGREAILNRWTRWVSNYLMKENLVMYDVWFNNIHTINRNGASRMLDTLNDKRLELKSIIKDLNEIKHNIK